MKKLLSLVLALSMVLGMFSFAFAAKLSDIEGEYYQAAVEALVELGVVSGYPDDTYRADQVVTRAELAKMIVVCLGQEKAAEIAKGSTQFTDVGNHWATGYINVASQYKIIVGYPDGTFCPEAPVSYAEAVTMVLRALGYKNVVESAGDWPTNYITKATELQLLKDMVDIDADAGAKRGNVAVLLWNMLRTRMWDIISENQTNGMTYGEVDYMLNIKFPDFTYNDEGEFVSFEVEEGKVEVVVKTGELNKDKEPVKLTGDVENVDLLRLVAGMEVAYLYDKENEEFLTLTCVDELVEGRVDEKEELNGKEYKNIVDAEYEGKYVVALVEGKTAEKVLVLPEGEAYEVGQDKTLKKAKKDIGEDALVIIDGVWATAEDLEEGDVVTTVTKDDNDANVGDEAFYVVARANRVNGEFESYTTDEDADGIRLYFEVDGEEYEGEEEDVVVYEYDEDDEEYAEVTEAAFDEFADKKGKYFGEEVELALDYLGNIVNVYFGEVAETEDSDINFYVMTGESTWFESSKDGMKVYAEMTGVDGEDTYEMEEKGMMEAAFASLYDFLKEEFYDAEEEVWAEEDLQEFLLSLVMPGFINDDEQLEFPTEEDLAKQFVINPIENAEGIVNEENYLVNNGQEVGFKVGASTKVFTIRAVIEDDEVVGIEVEITEGPDALEGVEYGLVALKVIDEDPENLAKAAAYVFVTEDSKSTDLEFGLVERYLNRAGVPYVYISGERYEIDKENKLLPEVGSYVAFRNTDGVIVMAEEMKVSDISDNNGIVEKVEDGIVTFVDGDDIDLEKESDIKPYEKVTFVLGTASLDEDDMVEFDAEIEVLGKGLEGVSLKKGDRLVAGKLEDVIVIVRGFKADDNIIDGLWTE